MKLNDLKLSEEMINKLNRIQDEINYFLKEKNMKLQDAADWNLIYLYITFISNIPLTDIDSDSYEKFENGIIKG